MRVTPERRTSYYLGRVKTVVVVLRLGHLVVRRRSARHFSSVTIVPALGEEADGGQVTKFGCGSNGAVIPTRWGVAVSSGAIV